MARWSWSIGLLIGLWASTASSATLIKDVRLSATADGTRVVFDVSGAPNSKLFMLTSPDRVVLDISDGELAAEIASLPTGRGLIKELRAAPRGDSLRIVLDVAGAVTARSFTIDPTPQDSQGHRLVIDLTAPGALTAATPSRSTSNPLQVVKSLDEINRGRDLVIAIDAGHGGKDPGAIGRRGTQEKDVALEIACKLKARIDAEPGMSAILTRDGDYYVAHRERMRIAHQKQADLFVSIHADSVRDRSVTGSSVYVLSAGRATNEAARLLADRENAADLIGGVSLDDKDNVLASVLLDLSQGASMTASATAASNVLSQLDRVSNVLNSDIKHASLIVLTSPDIPSMLVETAFISNASEEAKLRDVRHQQRLAEAVHAGVRAYFYDNPPPGTRVAQFKSQRKSAGQGIVAAGVSP
ncbi:MAG TPA: N-acetylmuramoyl-L-alanine amidase [Steroidobacteraceae bacterium]|nr:N-acetylmuramoyl-L-alanine amidase [Steroidobacteraceae bacterium]